MLLEIFPSNPDQRKIQTVVDCLNKGGIIIFPTDTVYSIGCNLLNKKALEKVARIKNKKLKTADFSIICHDLSNLSEYTRQVSRSNYKVLNRSLPGPFTFILDASSKVPKLFDANKKTIGIRIPDNNIPIEIVKTLGNPIITSSIHSEDEILDYTTDPFEIYERFSNIVDIVIDGGYGNNVPSTVVDCTGDTYDIIRQGIGQLD